MSSALQVGVRSSTEARQAGRPKMMCAAGLGDHRVVTTLCPGGKERMRRLVDIVASGRGDLAPLVTQRFPLERIKDAYEFFSHPRDGVLKIVITP